MDHSSRLRSLLATCAWVKDGDWLRALGPELAGALPPLVSSGDLRDDGQPALPVTFGADLWPALCATLAELALHALDRPDAAAFDSLPDDQVLSDALVAALVPIAASAAVPGLRAGAIPALALAWGAGRVLSGREGELFGVPDGTLRAARAAVARLSSLDDYARGAVFARVAAGLAVRHAAAWEIVRRGGGAVPDEPLANLLLSHPLAVAVPRGAWAEGIPFGLLAGAFDVPTDAGLVRALGAAAAAARRAVDRRRAARKPVAADLVLERLAPGAGPEALLLHPSAGPFLVASLPALVEPSDLKAAGLAGPVAKALRDPLALRALAAALADLSRPALEWDWLSALVDRVVPLRRSGERWFAGGGAAPGGGRWGLMVPRGPSEAGDRAVAAVRLTGLREAVGEAARARQLGDADGAVERAWVDLALESGAVAFCRVADHGVAVFPAVDAAARFAERAQRGLSGPRELLVGPHGARVEVTAAAQAAVGLDVGRVFGGTDGEASAIAGPAVGVAVALAGTGAPEAGASDDPLGMREVQVGGLGLRSHGVLCSDAAARALVEGARRRGLGVHEQGTAETVAGLSTDFRRYPVSAWWDAGGDEFHLLLRLGGARGPAELKRLSASELRRFHTDDARQWAMEQQRSAVPTPAVSGSDLWGPDPVSELPPGETEASATVPEERGDDLAAFFGYAPTPAPAASSGDATVRMPTYAGSGSGFSLLDHTAPEGAASRTPAAPDIAFFGPGDDDPTHRPAPTSAPPMLIEVAGPPMLLDGPEFGAPGAPAARPPAGPPMMLDAPGWAAEAGGSAGGPAMEDDAGDAVLVSEVDPEADVPGGTIEVVVDDFGDGPESFGGGHSADGSGPSVHAVDDDDATDAAGRMPAVVIDDGIDDDEDTDAAIDAAWGRAALAEPAPPAWMERLSVSPPPSGAGTAEQLGSLFDGYVLAEEDDAVVFGMRDAVTLRDAHRFERGPGGLAAAYVAFVDAKIRESFLPQADLVYWVPPDVRVRALDLDLLSRAWAEVVG